MHRTHPVRRAALAFVLLVAVGASAASGSDDTATGTGADGSKEVGTGLGSADASADATGATIVREGGAGFEMVYGQVDITNNSSKRSNYFVTLVVESPDGTTRIDETIVSVMNLDPGQTSTEKGLFTEDVPQDAVISVIEVQRTAA